MRLYSALIFAVRFFFQLMAWAMILQALMSWFVNSGNQAVIRFYNMLTRFTDPIVRPCRRLLYRLNINTGMFDFSLLLAFLFLEILERVVIRVLAALLLL